MTGSFNADSLLSSYRAVHTIDFSSVSAEELQGFEIPFSFLIDRTGILVSLFVEYDSKVVYTHVYAIGTII